MQFSADGAILVAADQQHHVRLWDVASGKRICELLIADRHDPMAVLSPGGRYMAVAADNRTLLYEVRAPHVRATIAQHPHPVTAIELADAGGTLLCTSERPVDDAVVDSDLTSWNLRSGQRQRVARLVNSAPDKLRFRPSRGGLTVHGPVIVANTAPLGSLQLRADKRHAGMPLLNVPHSEPVIEIPRGAMAFLGAGVEVREDENAFDGKAIRIPGQASGAGIRFRIPDAVRKSRAQGSLIVAALRVERRAGSGPAFDFSLETSPARIGRQRALAEHVADGDYHLWLCDWTHFQGQAGLDWIDATLTMPEKAAVKAVWVDRVFLIPLSASQGIQPQKTQEFVTFAPDGKRLWGLVGRHVITSWRHPQLDIAFTWDDFAAEHLLGYASTHALAVGNRWVIVGNERGDAVLVAAATGERAMVHGPGGSIRAAALHPSEAGCILGTQKGNLRFCAIPGGEVLADLPKHAQSVEAIAFSADGQLLTTGARDETVRLWRKAGAGYEPLLALKVPTGEVAAVRFTPDGRKLVVHAQPERAVRVWHLDRLQAHLGAIGLGW
jgi:hypothetical protein